MQILIELVDHDFHAAENDTVATIVQIDELYKPSSLRRLSDLVLNLLDPPRALCVGLDLKPNRVARIAFGQLLDTS